MEGWAHEEKREKAVCLSWRSSRRVVRFLAYLVAALFKYLVAKRIDIYLDVMFFEDLLCRKCVRKDPNF